MFPRHLKHTYSVMLCCILALQASTLPEVNGRVDKRLLAAINNKKIRSLLSKSDKTQTNPSTIPQGNSPKTPSDGSNANKASTQPSGENNPTTEVGATDNKDPKPTDTQKIDINININNNINNKDPTTTGKSTKPKAPVLRHDCKFLCANQIPLPTCHCPQGLGTWF